MAFANQEPAVKRSPIRCLRWWIGGLLFASTIINYIDRQTLSVLAPFLKTEFNWTNSDYAKIVIAFRVAYTLGQTLFGRLLDRMGTRRGLTFTVVWYSLASMLTSLAMGLRRFAFFRFLLGAGESANWPAATKAVSEWFPRHERGWAVALFDSGSSIGGAVASVLVLWIYFHFGWRAAFVIPGVLGLLWLAAWRLIYHPLEFHPRVSDAEREMILRDRQADEPEEVSQRKCARWVDLIIMLQTWGVICARALTDPVWFFITDSYAIYLASKGVNPNGWLIAFVATFLAADLGNFFGGGTSSWLIKRGWPVGRARKAVVIFGGMGMMFLIPTLFTSSVWALAGLFAFSTFAYASFSTMALVLPSDLYRSESVATVSGMSGTGAGIGTIISTYLIGYISDRYSFGLILFTASMVRLVGILLVLLLIRNTGESELRSHEAT